MIYAFISADGVVVNLIVGALSPIEEERFLADYRALFGATSFVVVASEVPVWIGGSYDSDSGTFTPPPTPEPEAVIEEMIPE